MSAGPSDSSARCRAMIARLSEYIDGELEAGLCAEVDGHLSDCAPCRELLDSLRQTVELVESLDPPPLPEDVRRRVREAYERYRRERG